VRSESHNQGLDLLKSVTIMCGVNGGYYLLAGYSHSRGILSIDPLLVS
jgi:hypothetical protein